MLLKNHTLDQYIINIGFHVPAYLILENFVHHPLICNFNILSNKWHGFVANYSLVSDESNFLFIIKMHWGLMISKICI